MTLNATFSVLLSCEHVDATTKEPNYAPLTKFMLLSSLAGVPTTSISNNLPIFESKEEYILSS
jgi:hypothetical protein